MQRTRRRGLTIAALLTLLGTGGAHATGPCAIDYNLNGARDVGDVLIFLQIYPSSYCDLNADLVVNAADATTLQTYYGLPVCPCWADYNADYTIDFIDLMLFINLYGAGSGRADLNLDGVVTFADVTAFLACWGPATC